MVLKTDLGDIHTRELADLKVHYRAKFRTKMLNFEQECQHSLRTKLSEVETSLENKHAQELKTLVNKYDTHIKTYLMEISIHE